MSAELRVDIVTPTRTVTESLCGLHNAKQRAGEILEAQNIRTYATDWRRRPGGQWYLIKPAGIAVTITPIRRLVPNQRPQADWEERS